METISTSKSTCLRSFSRSVSVIRMKDCCKQYIVLPLLVINAFYHPFSFPRIYSDQSLPEFPLHRIKLTIGVNEFHFHATVSSLSICGIPRIVNLEGVSIRQLLRL